MACSAASAASSSASARTPVQPDIFGTDTTFFAYTVLILGGAARVGAPVVGAMIFWVLLVADRQHPQRGDRRRLHLDVVINNTQVGQVRFMLVGLLLMLLMIFRPQGIFGDRREIALDAR